MLTLGHLAQTIRADLIGDPDAVVSRARPFDAAVEGDITFAGGESYRQRVAASQATGIITDSPIAGVRSNLLIASNPKLAFARAIGELHTRPYNPTGISADLALAEGAQLGRDLSIHPRVTIGRQAVIGDRVTLHPGVVIGDRCTIGNDTVVFAGVAIYDDCRIGERVVIHSGSVIGADGFSFVPDEEGHQVKLLQLGGVLIEDDCEIGSNCSIDRGGFGDTILRRGVKLDNLIQVGHNTEIGEDTVVAALTGFSGGTRVGRRCIIAGQVGTNQHITVGDGAVITARTGVTKSVLPGKVMGGMSPAQDYNEWRKCQAVFSRLPEIAERLRKLEKTLESSRG
jgi:UDP-3-O-[3-hydroxymyristoyl] glucosamine N-acyltransferase